MKEVSLFPVLASSAVMVRGARAGSDVSDGLPVETYAGPSFTETVHRIREMADLVAGREVPIEIRVSPSQADQLSEQDRQALAANGIELKLESRPEHEKMPIFEPDPDPGLKGDWNFSPVHEFGHLDELWSPPRDLDPWFEAAWNSDLKLEGGGIRCLTIPLEAGPESELLHRKVLIVEDPSESPAGSPRKDPVDFDPNVAAELVAEFSRQWSPESAPTSVQGKPEG